jgi:hypothetical protein
VLVAILGCGPSGLVAAHAAASQGVQASLFSRLEKSAIFGAQYLHQPIPDLDTPLAKEHRVIRYQMRGDPEAYLKKVYGRAWDGTVSDDLRDQAHVAWSLRAAYEELWGRYSPRITEAEFAADAAQREWLISTIAMNYDLVLNTIPRPALCMRPNEHKFNGTKIWAMGDSPDQTCPVQTQDGVIAYNGDSEPAWYRAARIFDYSTVEWPGHLHKPPVDGVVKVTKPLSHTCDCWTDKVVHLGRMGRWQNGRLVHHVYADTVEQILIAKEAAA